MSDMTYVVGRPATPAEIVKITPNIPGVVFEVFNRAIALAFRKDEARVEQKDIVFELTQAGILREDIFTNRWLDIEGHYRNTGWDVEYDRPAYNETYEPFWVFRPKTE